MGCPCREDGNDFGGSDFAGFAGGAAGGFGNARRPGRSGTDPDGRRRRHGRGPDGPGQESVDARPDPVRPEDFPRMKVYRCFDPRTFTFQCVRIR